MKNIVPTYIKVLAAVLIILLLLPLAVFFSLQIPPVQKLISQNITRSLSSALNTVVQVKRVGYSIDNRLVIKGIYVEDYNLDTLFYLDKASFWVWEIFKKDVRFNRIFINGLKVRVRVDTNGYSNLLYFLENLPQSEPKPKKKKQSNVKLYVKRIDITDFDIAYYQPVDSLGVGEFNPGHFRIYPLNFTVENLNVTDSTYSFLLYDLYFKDDESGFEIKNITADFSLTPTTLALRSFTIQTPYSVITIPKFTVSFDSLAQLAEPEKLHFFVNVDTPTTVSSKDIGYFVPQLKNTDFSFDFGFIIRGSLSEIDFMPFYLHFGRHTNLYLNGKILGLPHRENLYFDIEIDTLQTTLSDLYSVRKNGRPLLQIPENFRDFSFVNAQARITGLLNDLSFFLDMKTNLGQIEANADVKINSHYLAEGYITADSLNLNKLLKDSKLGKISFVDSFKIGLQDTLLWGENTAEISSFRFNNYTYQNINLATSFRQKHFFVEMHIDDPNIVANFDGEFDLSRLKTANFRLTLDTANLYTLNFEKQDPNSTLSFGLKVNMKGHNIDDVTGTIELSKPLIYIKNLELLRMDKFVLNSQMAYYIAGIPYKSISIVSDYMDASMFGLFKLSSLSNYFKNILSYYLPAVTNAPPDITAQLQPVRHNLGANLKTKVVLKDITPITRIFAPQIQFAPQTEIVAQYIDTSKSVDINFKTDSILIGENTVYSPELRIFTQKKLMNFAFKASAANFSILHLEKFNFLASAANDTLKYQILWNNSSKLKNYGDIQGKLKFVRNDSLFIYNQITYDSVFINDIHWEINKFDIAACKKIYDINILLNNPQENQFINVIGRISPNPQDKLLIGIQAFDLKQLNPVLKNLQLEGFVNSTTQITNVYEKPIIVSNSKIEKLKVNNVNLETLIAKSDFDASKNILNFSLLTERIILPRQSNQDTIIKKVINVNGYYQLDNQEYHVSLSLNKFRLRTLKPFVSKFITKIHPFASIDGSINIDGRQKDVNIKGELGLSSTSFTVVQTNVGYSINGKLKIRFDNNKIVIDTTTIISQGGSGHGKLWGLAYKNKFGEYVYNFNFAPDTLMVLNLPENTHNPYYGKAFVSGNINISGIDQSMSVNADIRSEENTDITFKINAPKTVSAQNDFITFISHDTAAAAQTQDLPKSKPSNVDLNVNLEVTPQSKFNIIIDEQTGEQLNLQGSGLLNIKLTPYGGMLMFGTLTIDQGYYNFSLENIITKKFKLQSGSTIKWNGRPTDAQLDLTATYTLKGVNLYDLTLDDNYWGERTQVNCLIKITGTLNKPVISFDLDLPKADQRIVSQVKNLDEAEKTKQVLSLLILGKFQPLPGLAFDPNQLASTMSATDVLSSQLSNLLSNIDENLELGIYQGQDQMELALSYKLWNERILINTDVGFGSQGNTPNPQNTNQFIGDVEIEVKLNKKGNLRFKAFNQTNRNEFYDKGPYTYGLGIFFQKDFSTLRLWPRKKAKPKKQKQQRDSLNQKQ